MLVFVATAALVMAASAGTLAAVPAPASAEPLPGVWTDVPLVHTFAFHAGTAEFGPALTTTPLAGHLIAPQDTVGTSDDACEPLRPDSAAAMNGQIAFMVRGNCSFTEKVKRVQDAGAIAAIVVNNVPGPPPGMAGADPTIVIPSVIVSDEDGFLVFQKSFLIWKVGLTDLTPPVVTAPSVVNVNATSPSGATVALESFVSATDDIDPTPAIACFAASGSTLPIGDTQVACDGQDAARNIGQAFFTVHVKGAGEQINDLIDKVVARLGLPATQADQLRAQLKTAAAAVLARDTSKACTGLRNFKLAVQLAQRASVISSAEAAELTGDADRIRAVLAC